MSASDPDLPLGSIIDGRWRLIERLEHDGAHARYRAEALKGGKPVRLELLDARSVATRELAARFDREARTVSRLDHPNCVAILGFGIHGARPYLVTPQLSGRRLRDELGKPQLTPARATRLAAQILEGLQHGHAHGVIHRELSPDKILLVGTAGAEQVKILDFGLARIVGDDKRRVASPAIDLHAVGDLLRAMVPANSSAGLERVIARARSDGDFGDAGEMLAALKATAEGRAAWRGGVDGNRRAGRVAVVALVLLPVGAGVFWWHRTRAHHASSPAVPPVARPSVAAAPPVAPVTQAPPAPAPAPTRPPAPAPAIVRAAPAPVAPAPTTPLVAPAPTTTIAPAPTAQARPAPAPAPTPTVVQAAPAPAKTPAPAPVTAQAPTAPTTTASPTTTAAPTTTAPTTTATANDATRARVEALLAQGALAEAEALVRAQLETDERAELHVELAEIFYRRFWRHNTITEWDRALALDGTLAHDPRIATRLCGILGARWNGEGAELIARRIGHDAVPALLACAQSAKDPARQQAATQLIERLGGKDATPRAAALGDKSPPAH